MDSQEKNSILEMAVKSIPYLGAVTYFLGFIIFTAYLSTFGIYEFNLLSFHYLKSGLIFVLTFLPVCFIIRHTIKTPTDNFEKNKDELFAALAQIGFYFLIISLTLFRKPAITTSNSIFLLVYIIFMFIASSNASRKWPKIIKKIGFLLPFFAYLVYVIVVKDWKLIIFIIMFQILAAIILFLYFDFGDKNLNPLTITSYLLMIVFLAALFGSIYYKEIPYFIGGPKNKSIALLFKEENRKDLESSPIKDSINGNQTKFLNLVYENDNLYYFFLSDSITLTLKKELFIGEMLNKNNSK